MNPCYDPDQCFNKSCEDCECKPEELYLARALTDEQEEELLAEIERENLTFM